ncbi:hypothetical protein L3i22_085240 [Actinoplanes sp. L3-i22]|nr:hypothetical protein L3i22_085240 [Actinoplanes sp. L3-i22]
MVGGNERGLRISRRLKHLYETVPGFTDDRVSRDLATRGLPVSPQYIQQLRTGVRNNPTVNVLYGIAEVFGVPSTYLIADDDEAKRVEDQLALLAVLKKAGVTALALRAASLGPEALHWLTEQVERERRRAGIADRDGF